MPCDFDREKIATYLDGECDPAARGMVASHLEGCGECRSLHEAFTENDAALKAADSASVPDGYWDSYEDRLLARLRLAAPCTASAAHSTPNQQPFLARVIVAALAAAAVFAITIGLAIQTERDRGRGGANREFEEGEIAFGKGSPVHGKGGEFAGKGGPATGPVAAQTKGGFNGQSSSNVVMPQQTCDQSQTMFWGSNDVPVVGTFLTSTGASAQSYTTLLVGCQQVMSQTMAANPNDPTQMESLQTNICGTGLLDQVSSERPITLTPEVKTKLFQAQVVFTSLANCTYDLKPDLGEFQVVQGSIVSNGLGSASGQSEQAATAPDVTAYQGAFNLLVQGQCAPAADAFSVFARDYPASPFIDKAAYWRGFSHVECGNYGTAIEILSEIPKQHPKSRYADDALYKVGEVYERYVHNYTDALKTYQEVVEKYPDSCVAVQSLQRNAQICEQKNDYASAVENWSVSLKKAESLDLRNRVQTKQSLQNRLPDNYFSRVAAARVAFIRAHADGDYVPLTRYTDAQTLARRGETDQAIGKYRALLGDYPKCSLVPYARLELAECLVRQGHESDALLLLEQVRSLTPPDDLAVRYKELMIRMQEQSQKQQEQQAK